MTMNNKNDHSAIKWPPSVPLSEDQKNAYKAQLISGRKFFRGVNQQRRRSDPGDLGVGTYFSSNPEIARCYGKLTTAVLRFRNPIVLSRDEAYERISDVFLTCSGTNAARTAGARAATRVLLCLGFDGLAAIDPLRNEWEVVVFPLSLTGGES